MPSPAADRLDRVARDLANVPADVVRAAAQDLRRSITGRLQSDAGGDARLSGVRGGRTLSVSAKVTDGIASTSAIVEPTKSSRGQVAWLDRGTQSRRQGAGRHPGTPAKSSWSDPVDDLLPDVRRRIADRVSQIVRR
jgi:hypothetical protein